MWRRPGRVTEKKLALLGGNSATGPTITEQAHRAERPKVESTNDAHGRLLMRKMFDQTHSRQSKVSCDQKERAIVIGLGLPELVIILVILAVTVVPAVGIFKVARRAGYEDGVSVLWAVAYVIPFTSWLVPLGLGFIDWPRDRVPAVAEAARSLRDNETG